MPRPPFIELGEGRDLIRVPILHEDRSVIAIDKPAGWLLVPFSWQRTQRNLQAAITSSIAAGAFWARSRNLKVLRAIHRLDGDTSGILLLARSLGAVDTFGELFESRRMAKTYLAVVHGIPKRTEWTCRAAIAPDPQQVGRMQLATGEGKDAETTFRVLQAGSEHALVEARPRTGRTHQIRLHLLEAGHPVVGDDLYGPDANARQRRSRRQDPEFPLGLRAIRLSYQDPFQRRAVQIQAPSAAFARSFGFEPVF